MKKLLFITITALLFMGCGKSDDKPTSSGKTLTIKYEAITTSTFITNPAPMIAYSNSTGQYEYSYSFPGTTWSKTITLTETKRPLMLVLEVAGTLTQMQGKITGNIYVNGEKKATATNPAIQNGNMVSVLLTYNLP